MKNKRKNEPSSPIADEATRAAANEPANMEEAISIEAYHLWEAAGCPEGCAEEFWFAAARKLGKPEQP